MHYKAKLTQVEGDQEEFSDLIDREGILMRLSEGLAFTVKGSDSLTMHARYVSDNGEKVVVSTKLGNKFTFKVLENK